MNNDQEFLELCLNYQEQICILLGSNNEGKNIFGTRNGRVVLNFDGNGVLQEVETDRILYRRMRE